MDYDEFDAMLKNTTLNKKDFALMVGMSYTGVTNWKQVKQVPVWVCSWLENYKKAQKYEKIKELIKDEI